MPKSLINARNAAFDAQRGRCFYCNLPMWRTTPMELTHHGTKLRLALILRCTAEQLVARKDG